MNAELKFDRYLEQESHLIHGPEWKSAIDDRFVIRALSKFSLDVMTALHGTVERSIQLPRMMTQKNAAHYLHLGAAHRLLILWHAYRKLLDIVTPDRAEPLTNDESLDLTQNLNTIYINICGTLDNLSWVLLHEHAIDKVSPLTSNPTKVGLFKPSVIADGRFTSLVKSIQAHKAWDEEVKSRRHPATHRIPLRVPRSVLSQNEDATYQKLYNDYWKSLSDFNFDEAEDIKWRIDGIGLFSPVFLHDPDQGLISIYPTVPDDIGHVIELFTAVDRFLVNASSLDRTEG